MCSHIAHRCDAGVFEKRFLEPLVALAHDKVPNVRITAALVVNELLSTGQYLGYFYCAAQLVNGKMGLCGMPKLMFGGENVAASTRRCPSLYGCYFLLLVPRRASCLAESVAKITGKLKKKRQSQKEKANCRPSSRFRSTCNCRHV